MCFEIKQPNVISHTDDLKPKTEPKRLETELTFEANLSKSFLVDQLNAAGPKTVSASKRLLIDDGEKIKMNNL